MKIQKKNGGVGSGGGGSGWGGQGGCERRRGSYCENSKKINSGVVGSVVLVGGGSGGSGWESGGVRVDVNEELKLL